MQISFQYHLLTKLKRKCSWCPRLYVTSDTTWTASERSLTYFACSSRFHVLIHYITCIINVALFSFSQGNRYTYWPKCVFTLNSVLNSRCASSFLLSRQMRCRYRNELFQTHALHTPTVHSSISCVSFLINSFCYSILYTGCCISDPSKFDSMYTNPKKHIFMNNKISNNASLSRYWYLDAWVSISR